MISKKKEMRENLISNNRSEKEQSRKEMKNIKE